MQVFAGVVEVDDLGRRLRETLFGDVPDPAGAVADDDELADVAGAATARFGLDEVGEGLNRLEVAR